jgi:hypothetical protein
VLNQVRRAFRYILHQTPLAGCRVCFPPTEKDALDRIHGHVRHTLALVANDGDVWVTDRAARTLANF